MPSTYINKAGEWLADIVFPIRCLQCSVFKSPEDLPYACQSCLADIKIRSDFECIGCKSEVPLGQTCLSCALDWQIDRLFISADFQTPLIANLIKALKYGFARDSVDPLFHLIHRYIKNLSSKKRFSIFSSNPLVIPLPLATRRLNWRGFNQSELLARLVCNTYYMEMRTDLISRKFIPVTQTHTSSRQERLDNVASAFSINAEADIYNREILLIDDVCTTGATLNACAIALKKSGAGKVSALVIARDAWKK